ncbi:MAG: hypothetical protein ABNH16_06980 [Thalassolituus sp.]
MSAVKRVFTHSAIRSPFRKPFVPGDDGYREYLKRSVFEFNGTQWGELSEPVVLSGDFEISILLCPTSSAMHILADGEGVSRFWFNSTSLVISATSGYVSFPNTLITGQLSLIVLRRESDAISIYVNGDELTPSTGVYLTNAVKFNTIGGQVLTTSLPMLIGIASNLSVVDAGELILDVPFDESGSDYQRDLTSTITDINDPGWRGVILQNALPDDWMQIEKKRWWDYWREVGNESNILEIAS